MTTNLDLRDERPTHSGLMWRQIETAPHGEPVLLGWWYEGKWRNEVAPATTGWRRGAYSTMSQHGQATHWLPLPAPPRSP